MKLLLVVFNSCGMVENSQNGVSRSLNGVVHCDSRGAGLLLRLRVNKPTGPEWATVDDGYGRWRITQYYICHNWRLELFEF